MAQAVLLKFCCFNILFFCCYLFGFGIVTACALCAIRIRSVARRFSAVVHLCADILIRPGKSCWNYLAASRTTWNRTGLRPLRPLGTRLGPVMLLVTLMTWQNGGGWLRSTRTQMTMLTGHRLMQRWPWFMLGEDPAFRRLPLLGFHMARNSAFLSILL